MASDLGTEYSTPPTLTESSHNQPVAHVGCPGDHAPALPTGDNPEQLGVGVGRVRGLDLPGKVIHIISLEQGAISEQPCVTNTLGREWRVPRWVERNYQRGVWGTSHHRVVEQVSTTVGDDIPDMDNHGKIGRSPTKNLMELHRAVRADQIIFHLGSPAIIAMRVESAALRLHAHDTVGDMANALVPTALSWGLA